MKADCPSLFYENVMKAAQEQAELWLPPNKRYTFTVEIYRSKKHEEWNVSISIKKGKQ